VVCMEGVEHPAQGCRQGEGEEGQAVKRSVLRAHGVVIPNVLQNQRPRRDNNTGSEGATDKEIAMAEKNATAEKTEEKAPDPAALNVEIPAAVQENLGVTPELMKAVGEQAGEMARFVAYSVVAGAQQGARKSFKEKTLELLDTSAKGAAAAAGVGAVYGLVLLGKMAIGAITGDDSIDS